jgi:hypothetical protein
MSLSKPNSRQGWHKAFWSILIKVDLSELEVLFKIIIVPVFIENN